MLIENEKVIKTHILGLIQQTLAGKEQNLRTMEVWLLTLPPGSETVPDSHYGEVVGITLKGTGLIRLGERHQVEVFPNTTLVVPADITRQVTNTGKEDLVILVIRALVRPPDEYLED